MSRNLQAAIFDMDGVVTRTAGLHAAAWKAVFDPFLSSHAGAGEAARPFDAEADYRAHVDGKPREDGIRSFMAARGIAIAEGGPQDVAGTATVGGLARRKDEVFDELLKTQGVASFASTLSLVRALRARGVRTAVVSSSRHGREILAAGGLEALFDLRLDGIDRAEQGLRGKPDPDMFVRAAQALGVAPGNAVVFEDALAGVQAGRRGGFGLVVGVDRAGTGAAALARAGADIVVGDLGELDLPRLEAALAQRQEQAAWLVEEEGYDPAREHALESLFAVGNGYLGVRGALDAPPPGSQPDLFIAGVYDCKRDELPYSEVEFLAPGRGDAPDSEIVSAPFPFRLRIALAGQALEVGNGGPVEVRRTLDLRRAALRHEAVHETPGGRRTTLRTRRCACAADPHLLLQELRIDAENHSGAFDIDARLDTPELEQVHPHLQRLEVLEDGALELLHLRTRVSGVEVCIVSRVLLAGGQASAPRMPVSLRIGEPLVLRRFVSVFTSRDGPDPRGRAVAHARAWRWDDFEAQWQAHESDWAGFWRLADLRIGNRPGTEQALRFGSYHLRLPAPRDPRVSVPARALTGRAYEGHVFWDTEIFMLPFHLHTQPAVARDLLLYRHGTLDGARRRARQLGYEGACFAWESTLSGEDVTPTEIRLRTSGRVIPIFTGTQQIHVTADIAYAAWRYWEATGDEDFLQGPGAELLAETARFWAACVSWDGGQAHLRGVVGPDEYHHSVDDNAYTNWMARFNLERAAWLAGQLDAQRRAALVRDDEPQAWAELAQRLVCPGPNAQGVIEQFEGFFALEPPGREGDSRFRPPVDRLFDWEAVNRRQLIKQADVLMLPFLFPEAFSDEVVAANYRYYEPRTDHASSLSPPVHAAIAARLGLREEAERHWRRSLWLDLSNEMTNSALGVHPACMGATWQALVFGWLGVRLGAQGPRVQPGAAARLPASWGPVALNLAWRGQRHPLRLDREGDCE